MLELSESQDFDTFFYYGSGELEDETITDMRVLLFQGGRSLLYSRSRNAAGIRDFLGYPNALYLKSILPFFIVEAVSKRNDSCGNGQNGTKERRVSISQEAIEIFQDGNEVDITVNYIPYSNLQKRITVSTKTGVK